MPKLYFLRGALGDVSLIEEQKAAIKCLLSGDYDDDQLEKLKGHDVYSFRLGKKARLLFAIHPIGGASRLVVLEYLPTHKYKRSRFLKSSVLKCYLIKQEDAHQHFEMPLTFEVASDRPVLPVGDDETQEIDWQVVDYHKQKLIELSLEQQAVMHVDLPALISGGAGSGKSCVALSLLSSWCEAHCVESDRSDDDALPPILYVSQSRPLVDSMRRSWMDLPLSAKRTEVVLFLTYEELLCQELRKATTSPPLRIIGRPEFTSWYQSVTTGKKREAKAKQQDFTFLDEESAYQEFRILSGCSSYEDYLSLGQRESLVSKEKREMTYAGYQAYLKYLKDEDRIQPAFHSFTPKNKYSMVVVDEAQDFSPLQLIQLGRLANQSAVFCMDGHQSIQDRRTPRPFVLKYFDIKEASHIQLNLTYRCPEVLVTAANQVLLLKHRLQGGVGDKNAPTRIDRAHSEGGLGHLFLIDPKLVADNAWLNAQVGEAHCAIVTAPKHFEAAKSAFKTPLVFTPETIKGLEFPVVVAYKLYDPELFREAGKRLKERVDKKQPQHQPKDGCGDERFAPSLSQIFTAYTRAQCVLVVSEDNNKTNEILLHPLRGLADSVEPSEACLQHETFAQDWNQLVIEVLEMDNKPLALTLYISKLGGTEATFNAWVELNQRRLPATLKPEPEAPLPQASAITPVLRTNTFRKPLTALNVSPPLAKSVDTSSPLRSPTQSSAVAKKVQVAKAVKGLVGDFKRNRLEVVMKLADDGNAVWLTQYDQADGTKFCLADLLEDPAKREELLCCLINNTDLLIKMPYEAILSHITNSEVQSDIRTLMQFRLVVKKVQKQTMFAAIDSTVISLVNSFVYSDDVKGIKLLHKMGVNVNKPDKKGGATPAFNAAAMGRAGAITALKDCGACLDTPTGGITPTFIAAQEGYAHVITALIAGEANLNTPYCGATPAYVAAQNGHAHVIMTLAAGGANLDTPNCGATPACIAAQNGHARVITALKAGCANLDTKNDDGVTPTYIAAQRGHAHVIAALIATKANLNSPNKQGASPLYIAAQNGHTDVVAALIAAGANINTPIDGGATPAFIAAKVGHAAVITLLKAAGANMDTPTQFGETPASIAKKNGHTDVSIALRAGGSLSQCSLFRPQPHAVGKKGQRTVTSPVSPELKFPK